MPESIVQRIHFEDRSGFEFERLAFAYILRVEEWESIDWYGQLGSDRGRDIWGTLSNRGYNSTVCYQCANHQRLVFKKAEEDIDKICSGPHKIPHRFVLIVGGKVSANMRTRVAEYASSKGISIAEVWSGPEFEERLRRDTPDLIRRFCDGIGFPESVPDTSRGKSITEQLWEDIFDRNVAASDLLRKALVLAHELHSDEFRQWVTNELDGYSGQIPNYRIIQGQLKARNPYRGLIPITWPDVETSQKASTMFMNFSIPKIEQSIAQSGDQIWLSVEKEFELLLMKDLRLPAPPVFIVHISTLTALVETVRTEIMKRMLRLEKDATHIL
jgi:hypothetical protein